MMAAPITSVEVQILKDVLSAFGLALATAVKQDAVQAVLSQGANLAKRQDGHAIKALPRKEALIIGDGTVQLEGRLNGFVPLVRFASFCNGANRHLRRQTKLLADAVIDELLQPDFVRGAMLECHFRNGVASRIEPFHRLQQHLMLFSCWHEFDHQCQVHASSIAQSIQCGKEEADLLHSSHA